MTRCSLARYPIRQAVGATQGLFPQATRTPTPSIQYKVLWRNFLDRRRRHAEASITVGDLKRSASSTAGHVRTLMTGIWFTSITDDERNESVASILMQEWQRARHHTSQVCTHITLADADSPATTIPKSGLPGCKSVVLN